MDDLVACKYEEDPIKNECARVFTTFSLLISYGIYLLPWKPEFQSYLELEWSQHLVENGPVVSEKNKFYFSYVNDLEPRSRNDPDL